MSEVLQTNIFFFITGIAVIVCSALLCVLLFHGIKVLTSLRRIVDRIEAGTEVIAEDLEQVRTFFTQEGFLGKLLSMLTRAPQSGAPRASKGKNERRNTELKIKGET